MNGAFVVGAVTSLLLFNWYYEIVQIKISNSDDGEGRTNEAMQSGEENDDEEEDDVVESYEDEE